MDYTKITMDDIRYLIKDSQETYNRYNVEAIRPDVKHVPKGYIFDEDKSVKWNKEQVEALNKKYDMAIKKYHKDLRTGYENFWKDLKQAIQNDYNFTEAQAKVIMDHIYRDGMYDDLDRAEELCEIVYDILNNSET